MMCSWDSAGMLLEFISVRFGIVDGECRVSLRM
jgi:hypothetical protein